MSQFAKNLQCYKTEQIRPDYTLLAKMMDATITTSVDPMKYLHQYEVGVKLSTQFYITDQVLRESIDSGVLNHNVNRAKRLLVEAVFGEFRENFLRMRHALYERDYDKLNEELDNFQDKMFNL